MDDCCRMQRSRWTLFLVVICSLFFVRAFLRLRTEASTALEQSSTKSIKNTTSTSTTTLGHVSHSQVPASLSTAGNRTFGTSDARNNQSGKTTIHQPYVPASLPIKTLVILFGNLRCGELAWESLYRNLIDYNNNNSSGNNNNHTSNFPHRLDLALAIGDPTASMYPNASLLSRADFVFTFPEYGDDWSDALALIDPDWKGRIAPLLANTSILLGGVPYSHWHGSGAISFWIRWFLSQQLVQHNLLTTYDRFVITRTDHFYMCPHDLSALDPQYLWVPKGQDYGGITDRHLIVPSQYVLQALDVLPALFQNPSDYPMVSDDWYNPEQLLLDRWKKEGLFPLVRRFPRMMFTCGNPHVEDSTRWKQNTEVVDEGVRKKYRKEYLLCEDTCKEKRSQRNSWTDMDRNL